MFINYSKDGINVPAFSRDLANSLIKKLETIHRKGLEEIGLDFSCLYPPWSIDYLECGICASYGEYSGPNAKWWHPSCRAGFCDKHVPPDFKLSLIQFWTSDKYLLFLKQKGLLE